MPIAAPFTMLALLVALMAGVDAFLMAVRRPAPGLLPPDTAELAAQLRFAFVEPVVSVVALLLILLSAPVIYYPVVVGIVLCSLAWILIRPLRGRPLADPALRAARATLLRLSLARWATLILPALILPSAWPYLSFVGAAVLWRMSIWGSYQLTNVLVPQRAGRAAGQALAPGPAAPPAAPARPAPSPTERLLRAAPPGPPLRCAGCGAASPIAEAVCPSCGLVFASRIPAALAPLAARGYHLLRPLGAGGMSAAYLAYESSSPSWCCLKTIVSVDQSGDVVWRRQAAASLAHEASVLAELDHPQVSRMRAWLDDPLRPCLALELISGASLEQALAARGGPGLPATTVCAWGKTATIRPSRTATAW